MTHWENWAGTVTATPAHYERPRTEAQLRSIVTDAARRGETVRVAGSGHSFSSIVPSDDTLISLERFEGAGADHTVGGTVDGTVDGSDSTVAVDGKRHEVTVRPGTTLSTLNRELAAHGLALSNLGDIDRQTVAGALATGTHGTGLDFGVLSTQLTRVRLLTADGEFVTCSREDDERRFRAAQVSLGALGVVTELTLEVVPAFDLCLRRRRLPLEFVLENLDQFHDTHRQWEFFWFPHTDDAIVKTFDEVPRGADRTVDDTSRRGVDDISHRGVGDLVDAATTRFETSIWETLCRVGTRHPWTAPSASRIAAATLSDSTDVGPSHEVFANPRKVRFDETEYGVPAADLPAVVREIREYIEGEDVPVQYPIECRFVGGDEPYLSPARGRDSGFVAVHAYHGKDLSEYFAACEAIFDRYDGRPHWGKQHSKSAADLAGRYPEWETFLDVRDELDPDGRFANAYVDRVLGT